MIEISTVILTKNEEKNIARCLESVLSISKEIIVVDSMSDDRTVEIAKTYTDNVYINPWPGFSAQRTFSLTKTSYDWVLWIDADEELSKELAEEIMHLDVQHDGYFIPRLVYYLGRWIRHCGWYPDYTLRFFNKHKGCFDGALVHETFAMEGSIEKLKNPIFHYPYNNISHHIKKMNDYTDLSAKQMWGNGKKISFFTVLTHSIFRFVKMYIIKCGFLDGKQGLVISILGSYYVFLKYIKLYEAQARWGHRGQ